jgi:hypothetical protein
MALPAPLLASLLACGVPDLTFFDDSADAPPEADTGSSPSGDAGPFCSGDPAPPGGKCCPDGGPVCVGTCNKNACAMCGTCAWPQVCCGHGAVGACQMPPCQHPDGGDGGSDGAAGEGGNDGGTG